MAAYIVRYQTYSYMIGVETNGSLAYENTILCSD